MDIVALAPIVLLVVAFYTCSSDRKSNGSASGRDGVRTGAGSPGDDNRRDDGNGRGCRGGRVESNLSGVFVRGSRRPSPR